MKVNVKLTCFLWNYDFSYPLYVMLSMFILIRHCNGCAQLPYVLWLINDILFLSYSNYLN